MLNRMKERGWIKEYANKEDKHSKRIELRAKGEHVSEYDITGLKKMQPWSWAGPLQMTKTYVFNC